jgi:hypothetical protein
LHRVHRALVARKRLLPLVAAGAVVAAAAGAGLAVARVEAVSRLPRYGHASFVGVSREFGSVYVTDAIGSADFNGDGNLAILATPAFG